MATQTTAIPAHANESASFSLVPALSLWQREVVRFYRNLSRVVGVIASPLLFWIVIGSGFGTSFRNGGSSQHYLEFFFPGALIMIVLFTSIFAMMSLIEDRNQGFLLSVLVAPVHRSVIVLGKVLGGTTLATLQGLIFLVFAPLVASTSASCNSCWWRLISFWWRFRSPRSASPLPGRWIPHPASTPSSTCS